MRGLISILIYPISFSPNKTSRSKLGYGIFRIFDLVLRILIFLFFFSLFLLAFIAPVIQHMYGYPAGEEIYEFLSPICHQYPTRCIWVFDRPFALCARCSFGYLGVSLSAIFFRFESTYLKRLLWGSVITVVAIIDPITQLLTQYESSNFLRVVTGLLGGMGVFLIFYPFRKGISHA